MILWWHSLYMYDCLHVTTLYLWACSTQHYILYILSGVFKKVASESVILYSCIFLCFLSSTEFLYAEHPIVTQFFYSSILLENSSKVPCFCSNKTTLSSCDYSHCIPSLLLIWPLCGLLVFVRVLLFS